MSKRGGRVRTRQRVKVVTCKCAAHAQELSPAAHTHPLLLTAPAHIQHPQQGRPERTCPGICEAALF